MPLVKYFFTTRWQMFFFETSVNSLETCQDWGKIEKTVKNSLQTCTVQIFQKQNNYLNNTANCHFESQLLKTVDLNEIHSQFTVTVGYNHYLANTLWAWDFYHVKVNKGTACQWANYHA